jgi:hypothetical protein
LGERCTLLTFDVIGKWIENIKQFADCPCLTRCRASNPKHRLEDPRQRIRAIRSRPVLHGTPREPPQLPPDPVAAQSGQIPTTDANHADDRGIFGDDYPGQIREAARRQALR